MKKPRYKPGTIGGVAQLKLCEDRLRRVHGASSMFLDPPAGDIPDGSGLVGTMQVIVGGHLR